VLGRRHRHLQSTGRWKRFPPVEFLDIRETALHQVASIAQSGHEERIELLAQAAQGRQIHVIVMIVTNQHEMNGR
jgi:hypothetical protein